MLIGPITLEAKVHFVNDATGQIGNADVSLPAGKPVTVEALHRAVGQTLAALPEGFRLMDGGEFFNKVLIREKFGRDGNFATPDGFSYDSDALSEAGRAAYTPPEPENNDVSAHDDFDDDEDEF